MKHVQATGDTLFRWAAKLLSGFALLLLFGGAAYASSVDLPPLAGTSLVMLYIVGASALVSLGYGIFLIFKMSRHSPGSASMREVQAAIHSGAVAYLKKQASTMIWLVLLLAGALYLMYAPVQDNPTVTLGIALAFLAGAASSYIAGVTGMWMAVRGNARVAHAALSSFKTALEIAFQSGAVAGMVTVGTGLLGATVIFLIFQENAMHVLVGFGFGGSLVALFMRVGGGIFTKAADVGADLVGKVEAGIPEDDPRNPAVIADNVGDNVGDCAGMAADIFESYAVTLVASIILGAATQSVFGVGSELVVKLIMYAFLVRAIGVFASILGVVMVKGRDDLDMNPMHAISRGFTIASTTAVIGFGVLSYFYLNNIVGAAGTAYEGVHYEWWRFFGATLIGVLLAKVIEKITDYYTSAEHPPVTEISESSRSGPAPLILTGIAQGLESSVWSVVAISTAIMATVLLFPDNPALSMYAIALAGSGLLATTGFLLAEDTYGPISDNANGIFEMSGALNDEEAKGNNAPRHIVAHLDMVGNTTKALTKGFAIATAVIAAVALFRSFMEDALLTTIGLRIDMPHVFVGALIGAAIPFLFSSMAINSVSRAAQLLIHEVRRQFREMPGIMNYTQKPDYARCVAIVTTAAQKELLAPGVLAIATPVLIGFLLGYGTTSGNAAAGIEGYFPGAMALGGFLAGSIIAGQLLAVFLSNSGGAWDNAKKKIEDGFLGGKGSDAHKAAVIGDTVGDPFKDTAGPSLNILIKVMNLVAILIAPLVILPLDPLTRTLIVLASGAALVGVILFAKRPTDQLPTSSTPQVTKPKPG